MWGLIQLIWGLIQWGRHDFAKQLEHQESEIKAGRVPWADGKRPT